MAKLALDIKPDRSRPSLNIVSLSGDGAVNHTSKLETLSNVDIAEQIATRGFLERTALGVRDLLAGWHSLPNNTVGKHDIIK